MSIERIYSSRRRSIVKALVEALKQIDGSGEFNTNISGNVEPKFLFWDEIKEFPAIHVNAGSETRQYQGGQHKDRFLAVAVRMYVEHEDATDYLGLMIEDVETVLEQNSRLEYFDRGIPQSTHQITIIQIDTDEGVLEPLAIGEIQIEVRY